MLTCHLKKSWRVLWGVFVVLLENILLMIHKKLEI